MSIHDSFEFFLHSRFVKFNSSKAEEQEIVFGSTLRKQESDTQGAAQLLCSPVQWLNSAFS